MAVIDTVTPSRVTVPSFLRDKANGQLDKAWMRCPDARSSTAMVWMMFEPVSYAMTAMQLAKGRVGLQLTTTGRYRSYAQQEALFRARYTTTELPGRPSKVWNGQRWWQKPGVAMAATPGTSNHGLGLADDVAELLDGKVVSLTDPGLVWLRNHAASYGFGLESRAERWHWHWIDGDALSQVVVDELYANGISVPDLAAYAFFVPPPTIAPDPPSDPEEPMRIYLARNPDNTSELRMGNGVTAVVLRSNEFRGFVTAWQESKRTFYHPLDDMPLDPMAGMDGIPILSEDDRDRFVGYPDYARTTGTARPDEG